MKPDDGMMSARSTDFMSGEEHREALHPNYLLYRLPDDGNEDVLERSLDEYQHGLMAFQIVKPVQTLGFIFQGEKYLDSASFSHRRTTKRPPTDAGPWARGRVCDPQLIAEAQALIPRILEVMKRGSVEERNSVIFLQLGLENSHPLIAGLLCVMGLESRLDSKDRHDFKSKLCKELGPRTFVFPEWNPPFISRPQETIEEIAIPLYMLRSKLAHGADLRKASVDKSTPVNLTEKVRLTPDSEPIARALMLSEAAIYLLSQVIRRTL